MTFEQCIYDLKRLLSKCNITIENRFSDTHLLDKINQGRVQLLEKTYLEKKTIDPLAYQDFGLVRCYFVGSGDDPNIYGESVNLGRFELKNVLTFDDFICLNVSTASRQKNLEKLDFVRLMTMIGSGHPAIESGVYFSLLNNFVYCYPMLTSVQVQAVIADPLTDGFFINNSHQDKILPGTSYKVSKGAITYDGTVYKKNQFFVGAWGKSSYTSEGEVVVTFNVKRRSLTMADDYPLSVGGVATVILNLLVREFKVEEDKARDIILDYQDDAKR